MPKPVAYIAVVTIGPATATKIRNKQNVTPADVREAVILCAVARSGWDHHLERGWRLLVTGTVGSGRLLNVVLYPVDQDDGRWRLGTAMWA